MAAMLEAAPTSPLDDWSLGHAWGALQQARAVPLCGVGLVDDSPAVSRLQPSVGLYSATGGVIAARCAAAAALHYLPPRAR